MNIQDALVSQYTAGLAMLKNSVSACHEKVWNDERDKNKFWHIAYHALFFTDLYLSKDEKHFVPWEQHHNEYEVLGDKVPWPPYHSPAIGDPYTQNEMLEYCERIRTTLADRIERLNFEEPSGFFWLPFGKLEVQIYNIRHLQHHSGQLINRIRERQDTAIEWISKGSAYQKNTLKKTTCSYEALTKKRHPTRIVQ